MLFLLIPVPTARRGKCGCAPRVANTVIRPGAALFHGRSGSAHPRAKVVTQFRRSLSMEPATLE